MYAFHPLGNFSLRIAINALHLRISLGILLLGALGRFLLGLSALVGLSGISGGTVVGVHVALGPLLTTSGSSLLFVDSRLGRLGCVGHNRGAITVVVASGVGKGVLDLAFDHAKHAGSRLGHLDIGEGGQLIGVDLW